MARAPRGGSWAEEYAARIARYTSAHPAATRSAARGHSRAERDADRLLRRLRKLPAESSVHFAGTDRQPDGTWRTARFDVLAGDGTEDTYLIPEPALRRLPEIRDAIAATGIAVLGAAYLETMVGWIEDNLPPQPVYAIRSRRSGRYAYGVSKNGNALTRQDAADAFTSTDLRRVKRLLAKYPALAKRGYMIVAV